MTAGYTQVMIEFRYHDKGAKPDPARKSCDDCTHCRAAVSLWCVSGPAYISRGTRIPGVSDCEFWEPMLPARWHDCVKLWVSTVVLAV